MGSQPGEATSLFIVLKNNKSYLDLSEMEMKFAMICAPKRSPITPKKTVQMSLWKSIAKRRDFVD